MMISKQELLASLPICEDDLTVRAWCREDVDRRAAWPPYPAPYSDFTSSLGSMNHARRDAYFRTRDQDDNRLTLSADILSESCIAHIVIRDLDWQNGMAGNMGFRVHPDWCDKGVGTRVLKVIVAYVAEAGITRLRLDVAEGNARAIRSYEKAGFAEQRRFDRDGVRFLWMELKTNERPTGKSRLPRVPLGT
jgi:RimJ/RimL family protein N-acetyltransferase